MMAMRLSATPSAFLRSPLLVARRGVVSVRAAADPKAPKAEKLTKGDLVSREQREEKREGDLI
jgi:hypothetical protein